MPGGKLHLGARSGTGTAAMAARAKQPVSLWRRLLNAALTLVSVAAAGWGVYWLLTGAYFQVSRIEIHGFRYLEQETVAARVRSGLGGNLWRLDTSALSDSLSVLPWIQQARLSRRPPGTLKVTIREWRPAILVAVQGQQGRSVLLGNGEIAEFPPHLPIPDLPVLIGASFTGDAAEADPASRLSDVLTILDAVESADLGAGTFVEFVKMLEEGYSVIMGPGQQHLLLGREQFAARMRRYRAVSDEVPEAAEVDLRFTGQVYIREKS